MKAKKLILLFVTFVLIIGIFSACSTQDSGKPQNNKEQTDRVLAGKIPLEIEVKGFDTSMADGELFYPDFKWTFKWEDNSVTLLIGETLIKKVNFYDNGEASRIEYYDVFGDFCAEEEFNEKGIRTKYNSYGNGIIDQENILDENGDIIKTITYSPTPSHEILWIENIEKTDEGSKRTTVFYNEYGEETKSDIFIEDQKGETVRRETYDEHGNLTEVTQYTKYDYDEDGKIIKMTTYNPSGDVSNKYEYSYDSNGNLSEERELAPNDTVSATTKYGYGEDGKMTTVERVDMYGKKLTSAEWKYEYDKNGDIVRKYLYDNINKSSSQESTVEYYKDRTVKKKTEYNEDNCFSMTEYDEYGNRTAEINRNGEQTETKNVKYTSTYKDATKAQINCYEKYLVKSLVLQ